MAIILLAHCARGGRALTTDDDRLLHHVTALTESVAKAQDNVRILHIGCCYSLTAGKRPVGGTILINGREIVPPSGAAAREDQEGARDDQPS